MKKLVIIFSSILVVFIVLLFWANYEFIGLTKDIFAVNYCVSKTLYSFDTNRDFHGDGFAIEVERLDNKSQSFFKIPPSDFFSKYPLRHAHLGNYRIYKWRKTPVAMEDTFRTNFGLKIDSLDSERYQLSDDAREFLLKAQKALITPGNYYALFFREHAYELYGLDLFIIDPNNGLVYKINRQ